MLRNNKILILCLILLGMSCSTATDNPNRIIWGDTDYYHDFLLKKYKPIIMTQRIEFEFNEDAKRLLNEEIELQVVEKDNQDKFVEAAGIIVYKNGTVCKDNILKIKPDEKQVDLGVEFTKEAAEGNHTLFLRVKNPGGLDRIDDTQLSGTGEIILGHEWVVIKNDVYNPLARWMFWILVSLLIILIFVIIITRINNPTFKIRKLQIIYIGSDGQPRPPLKSVPLKGAYILICSNRKQKQSIFGRLFKGKALYIHDGFWDKELVLRPVSFSKNKIRIERNPYDHSLLTINKGEKVTINNKQEKVELSF